MVFVKECVIKNSFHKFKRPVSIDKVDIKKIVLSSKESYGNKGAFKYFMGYIINVVIIPLYIKLPQMNAFAKYFDSDIEYMNLLVHDKGIYGIKLIIYLKNNLIVNQCIMVSI